MTNEIMLNNETVSRIPHHSKNAASRIIEYLSANPSSTVRDIAQGTSLSESAIRYVIIDLLAFGVIAFESHFEHDAPRSRGRPAQRYRLQKALILTTPPRRYWQLADMLISTILHQQGEDATVEMFKVMGTRAAHNTADQWRKNHRIPMSLNTFRKKLGETLNQLGYNASLKVQNKKLLIRTHNCLFQEVSKKYEGLMCHFHNTYYPTLFSLMCDQPVRSVERVRCISGGDMHCQLELHLTW